MKYHGHDPYAERQAYDVFRHINFKPKWLIDCGPGLGVEAWKFREKYPDINILGFEPNSQTYLKIKDTYPGVLLNIALGHLDTTATLFHTDTDMGATLYGNSDYVRPHHSVDMRKLDTIFGNWWLAIDTVLWADVEGAEESILGGAEQLLYQGCIRLMNLEVHEGENEERMDNVAKLHGFTKVCSYAGNGLHHDNIYVRN